MAEEFRRYLLERLREAEENLKKLEDLINIGRKAGLEISQYVIQKQSLEREIKRWKDALSG